jgi:signal transduction histidine kinase
MLAILLRDLVDNAVRYSPPGTTVRVQVRCEGASAVVAVDDEGPGVPPAQRERVWQRFYRLPGTAETGSGLGLSIVARIAELHAATVRLEDGKGGRGLRVVAVFPARQAQSHAGLARD